jgi:Mrp family chromosome partitioning ATPase
MKRSPGLSDVIKNKADIQSVVKPWKKNSNLKVVTAGNKPSNITEVVGSKMIAEIISKLKEDSELVIIDAPPLIIADTYRLLSSADGVIIVLEPGQTSDDQARTIKKQLDRANANIVGIVFNKVSEERVHSFDDFQYKSLYSPKQYGEYALKATKEPVTVSRSKKLVDFFEYGKVPEEMAEDVEQAITAIKTKPKNIFIRSRKVKNNDKTNNDKT